MPRVNNPFHSFPADSMPGLRNTVRVCYILSYRVPEYVRTGSILQALEKIEGVEVLTAINSARGIWRYWQTLWRLLRIRMEKDSDYYILGFRGYEIFWIVRLLTWGRPLIFDQMMSPYDSLVNERKKLRRGGVLDSAVHFYERSVLRHADIVLTDTQSHRAYMSYQFGIDIEKIHSLPVGSDEELFRPPSSMASIDNDGFLGVLFYGSFLPLHGIDFILGAAWLLRDSPVKFTVVGGTGAALRAFHETKKRLKLSNIIHKRWVPYEQLPDLLREADVCLGGPFGNTGQGRRVVTGKTLQAMAMGKAVIVGTGEADEGFRDRLNCLTVSQGSSEELAQAIRWCLENRDSLNKIGQRGHQLYRERFSVDCIKEVLSNILVL